MNQTPSALFSQQQPDNSSNEQEVNEVVNEVVNVAAPFIPGGPIAAKVSEVTGLAPAAVHLGFLFAHLFSHPKVAPVVAAAAAAPAPVAPVIDTAAVAAAAAEKQKQDAIAAINKQLADLQKQLVALQSA